MNHNDKRCIDLYNSLTREEAAKLPRWAKEMWEIGELIQNRNILPLMMITHDNHGPVRILMGNRELRFVNEANYGDPQLTIQVNMAHEIIRRCNSGPATR